MKNGTKLMDMKDHGWVERNTLYDFFFRLCSMIKINTKKLDAFEL